VRLQPGAVYEDPALHLLVVLINFEALGRSRKSVMEALRARGIGSQVHYIPVHRQPYYTARYGATDLPGADAYYAGCLSLPLSAGMEEGDVDRVVAALMGGLGL
jgi:dTDP-4-amino-4,6-dideoxygalactose transaminase